jgi:hypothetical protein
MIPREKAKHLFGKYATFVVMWAGDANTVHENCKQCALIAVDELIEHTDWTEVDYCQQVKQELEKL